MNSFTIYREYYDLISLLDDEEQGMLLLAISKYMFDDIEPNLNSKQMKIFRNLKRPLDKSKNKSKQNQNEIKMKSKQNQNEIKTETHQDVNVIVSNYDNNYVVNGNVNNNIYSIIENNFGRTLAPLEIQEMQSWLADGVSEELVTYAIQIAVCNNACSVKYISRILADWQRKKIVTLSQAKEEDKKFREKKVSKKDFKEPFWLNEEIKKCEVPLEEKNEMKELLKNFND